MDYNTIFVGMDVHKEKFSLCCYSIEKDEFSHPHTTAADYKHVLAYIASLRGVFSENASFLYGYEAGCLGFTLYHQLTEHNTFTRFTITNFITPRQLQKSSTGITI